LRPSDTQAAGKPADALFERCRYLSWPLVLNALAANALAYAITSARDNAHASKVMLQIGNALAGLERRVDRERV
jgi:hypothetical protein